MNTRVVFLRGDHYVPVGCVAIDINRRLRSIQYQFSVLNPTDKFDRKMARHLALGRLVECPISLPMSRSDSPPSMFEITKAVMKNLAESNAPNRAVKAAKAWLKFNY